MTKPDSPNILGTLQGTISQQLLGTGEVPETVFGVFLIFIYLAMSGLSCGMKCVLSRFSRVQLFSTLWAVACQAPLSMGLS